MKPIGWLLAAALVVAAACSPGRAALGFSPTELPGARVGVPYAATITVTQNETPVGDIYVSDGDPPPGLRLQFSRDANSTTAQFVGSPTAAGSYEFTVSAWCLGTNVSGQTGDQKYTLVVS